MRSTSALCVHGMSSQTWLHAKLGASQGLLPVLRCCLECDSRETQRRWSAREHLLLKCAEWRHPLHTTCFGAAVPRVFFCSEDTSEDSCRGCVPLCFHNLGNLLDAFMFHVSNLFAMWHIATLWKTVKTHVWFLYNHLLSAFWDTKPDNGFL